MTAMTVHDFTVRDCCGKETKMDKYDGKVLIIVNVASECGTAETNYTQLKEIYDVYHQRGLEIACFPCNQFGGQEPACEGDVKAWVAKKFSFEPDFYAKCKVNGDDAEPLFKHLKKEQGGFLIDAIKWNFTKFLVDKRGIVVKRFGPQEEPLTMSKDIEALL